MCVLIEKWQSVHSDVTQERQRDRDGKRVQWETQSRVQDLDLYHHDNVDAFTYTKCLWAQARAAVESSHAFCLHSRPITRIT